MRIERLSKSYRSGPALQEVNLEFTTVGVHLILGDNGSGKTSMLKCIAGLEQFSGNISWNNHPTAGNITASFEDAPAHPALTGLQNLSAALDTPIKSLLTDQATFMFLNGEKLKKKAGSLSFGQRRKLSLTTAFLEPRPCLLLDEPSAGLDASGREVLADQLRLAGKTRCVLVSDHETGLYEELAASMTVATGAGFRTTFDRQLSQAHQEKGPTA